MLYVHFNDDEKLNLVLVLLHMFVPCPHMHSFENELLTLDCKIGSDPDWVRKIVSEFKRKAAGTLTR